MKLFDLMRYLKALGVVTANVNEVTGVIEFTSNGERDGFIHEELGSVPTTVAKELKRGMISVFKYMTDAQIADVQAGTKLLDVTAALQLALNEQSAKSINFQSASSDYLGCNPKLWIPRGRYLISQELIWPSSYGDIIADKASFCKAAAFTGTRALYNSAAWRVSIEGLQFEDFPTALHLDSANANSGQVTIEKCGFFGSTENAIHIDCQSSVVNIVSPMFRSNKHDLYIESGDMVTVDGGWIQRKTNVLTDAYDGAIVNYGRLHLVNTVLVPALQAVTEPCWVKNYGTFTAKGVRFGGEPGQHTAVNNFALGTDVTADAKIGVHIDDCGLYVGVSQPSVRIFEIPNLIQITNNQGLTGSNATQIDWSSSVDSSAQATKIAAISSGAIRHRIYSKGNMLAVGIVDNLMFLADTDKQHLLASIDGTAAIVFDFRNVAITAGQYYGAVNYLGRDASGTASGLRAQTRVQATGTAGGTETVYSNAPDGGAVVDVAKTISTGYVPCADNARTLGNAGLRWSAVYGATLYPGAGAVKWTSGTGSPEGVLVAPAGSLYTRTDGGALTTLYIKESGAGNTGWVAK
jgi:hypothetical protein